MRMLTSVFVVCSNIPRGGARHKIQGTWQRPAAQASLTRLGTAVECGMKEPEQGDLILKLIKRKLM